MQLGWVNVTFCHTPTIYLSHMRQKQNDQAPRQRVLLIQIVCEQQDVWPLTQARAVLWESLFWGLRCWLWATVNTSLGSGHSLMRHYHVFITLTRRKTHGKSGRNRLTGSSLGVRAVRKMTIKQQYIKHSQSCILQWKYGHGQHRLPAWENSRFYMYKYVISFWLLFILCVHIFSLFCRIIILFWNFHYVEVSHLVSV